MRRIPKNLHTRALPSTEHKALTEQKNDLLSQADGILETAKTEERALTDDEVAEIEEIKKKVENINRTLELDEELRSLEERSIKSSAAGDDGKTDEEKEKEKEKQEIRAFEAYVRGTVLNERAGELTMTENGAVIPTTIANRIIKRVYEISPVLQRSQQYNVPGKLEIPYYDEENNSINVAYRDEFEELESSNGSFKNIELTGYLAGALSKISKSLINNTQFDITTFIVNAMADAIRRFIDQQLLIGRSDKVQGLSTLKNEVETEASTAITTDELIELNEAIEDIYQEDAIWVMNKKTRTAIRKLKDAEGRYLL